MSRYTTYAIVAFVGDIRILMKGDIEDKNIAERVAGRIPGEYEVVEQSKVPDLELNQYKWTVK